MQRNGCAEDNRCAQERQGGLEAGAIGRAAPYAGGGALS